MSEHNSINPVSTSARKANTKNLQKSFMASWWAHVRAALGFSLKRLWFNPLSTWITLAAIAIALSLPTGLHLFLKNLQTLTDDHRQIPTVSLFLKKNITEQQAKDRAVLLTELNGIERVIFVSKENAFKKMSALIGFEESDLKALYGDETPLPHVLVVTPDLSLTGQMDGTIKDLTKKLRSYPEVESVQADIEWVKRLGDIISFAQRMGLVVWVLLLLTVLLVVGNTIRLDIENRKEEIDVTRFIGATRSYIRRPFLFGGLWYGLFGGIISLVIVHFSLLFLIPPIRKLSESYGSHFTLTGLDFSMTFYILLISSFLGIVGAWIAVERHLRKNEVVL